MVTYTWINIDSGNGLSTDGTKPLTEPMLTEYQLGQVSITHWQFHNKYLNHKLIKKLNRKWLI